MDKDTALDKIKKLLSLAKSDNPNEAESALRQARKLMDQHRLEMNDVHASEASESAMDTGTTGIPPSWMIRLAQTCSDAFGCEIIISSTLFSGDLLVLKKKYSFKFIGVDIAPNLATYAYEVLLRQLSKARRDFVAKQTRCKLATKRRRGEEFANAWIDAVYQKIADFSGADEAHAQAITAFTQKNYPHMKDVAVKRRKTHGRDVEAYRHGFEAGKSAQLNRGVSGEGLTAIGRV